MIKLACHKIKQLASHPLLIINNYDNIKTMNLFLIVCLCCQMDVYEYIMYRENRIQVDYECYNEIMLCMHIHVSIINVI